MGAVLAGGGGGVDAVGAGGRGLLLLLRLLGLLLQLARRVAAAVFAEVNFEAAVILFAADGFDGFDGVGDVGEVDEGAGFLAEGVDELDLAVLGEVLSETLFGEGLVEVADVHVPRSAAADSQGDGRWKGAGVLAPSNLQTSVVDHEALKVAQRVERSRRCRIDERDEADVLVGDVADVVQKSTPDNIANFFDGGLRVDVAKVDSPVSKVVDATGSSSHGCRCNRLLGKSIGNQVTVCAVQDVGITRGNPKVLRRILLLSLGDVRTAVLSVVDLARCLPLRLLRELRDRLDSISNGQEVNKSDCLFTDNLDCIDGAELAQILAQLILGNVFRQITKVNISRSARLLHGECNRRGDLRRLAPADLDILPTDSQLLKDGIRVEVRGRSTIQERDERAVLIREESDGLNLATANMAQNLLSGRLGGNIAKIDGPARSSRDTLGLLRRSWHLHLHLHL